MLRLAETATIPSERSLLFDPLLDLRKLKIVSRLQDQADASLCIGSPRYVRPSWLRSNKETDTWIAALPRHVRSAQPAARDHIFNDTGRFPSQVPLIDPIDRIEPAARYWHRKAGFHVGLYFK